MRLCHLIQMVALTTVLPTLLSAQDTRQTIKPLDYSKQADVNGKIVHFDDLHFGTVSQPIRVSSKASPLSKGDLQFQTLELNKLNPNSVQLPTLPQPVLPKVNFAAKRAAVDKAIDQTSRQLELSKQNAPITTRVIRPFTPGGEEELKNQLNTPHP